MTAASSFTHDTLTGALARAEMAVSIQSALDDAQLSGSGFALVMLDMDEFKSINDAFGHSRGDQVLVEVVRRIHGAVRGSDQVFRYGGDEFILLLRGSNREQAIHVAGRVQDALVQQPVPGRPPVSLSASLGLAVYPDDASTPEELFEVIDQRMRLGKSRGRGVLVASGQAGQVEAGWVRLPGRLVEREAVMERVRGFMGQLGQSGHGLLLVSGPPGAGRTRLLEETARIARLQGYAVWWGCGSPAYSARRFGLLAEMQQAAGWRELRTRPAELAAALYDWLQDKRRTGLLICLDGLAGVDPATLECLLKLLDPGVSQAEDGQGVQGPPLPVALVGSGSLMPAIQSAGQSAPLFTQVELSPLSEHGVQIWLRHGLHWEAPAEFTHWLWQQTGGLPALLAAGLSWLVQEGLLRSEHGLWTVSRPLLPDRLSTALDAHPIYNLPAHLPPFFGREEIIWQVKNLLHSAPLVTLVAPDGAGKTSLAMQVVAELCDAGGGSALRAGREPGLPESHFPDGVFRAAYTPGMPPDRLPFLLGEVFQVSGLGLEDPLSGLAAALLGKRMLLVLDDLNPPLASARQVAVQLERLLQQVPGLRILAAARQPLGLPGEASQELDGLAYPAEFAPPVDYPAGQFFLHEARQARPAFQPTGEDEQAILRICRQVEGFPLGIEMAAAWVTSYDCSQIAREIEDNLGLLLSSPNGQDRPGLMAVMDSFWLLFSPGEQSVVASLAVFDGGFSGPAAAKVTGASSFFLDALAVKHYLHPVHPGRYTMHPLIARYVQAQLLNDPQRAAEVRSRHSRYFLEYVAAALNQNREDQWDLANLRPDLRNLRAAWLEAVSTRWLEGLLLGFEGLFGLLNSLSYYSEAIELAQAAVAVLDEGRAKQEALLKARLLCRLSEYCYHAGEYPLGETALHKALALLGVLQPPSARPAGALSDLSLEETAADQAEALRLLANLKQAQGDYAQALLLLEQARQAAAPLNRPDLLFNIANRAGAVALLQSNYSLAANYYETALVEARQAGDPAKVAVALNNLGEVAVLTRQYDRARSLLLESLSLTRPNSARTLHGAVLETLGLLERESGRFRAAALYFSRALRATLDIDAQPLVLEIFGNVAELWSRMDGEENLARAAGLARLVMSHPAAQHAVRQHAAGLAGKLKNAPPAYPNWTPQHLRRVLVEVLEILQ